MLQFLNLYLEIALLRRRPQEVPASLLLLAMAMGAALLSYAGAINVIYPLGECFVRALLDTAFLAACLYAVLLASGRRARFVQSLSALCGTGALLNLVTWPLFSLLHASGGPDGGAFREVAALLLSLLIIWGILVVAHILRHTLERSFASASVIAICYMVLAHLFRAMAFPELAA